jgi:hypothetical protein
MATTTNFALRYPLSSAAVNPPVDFQNLATDVDTQMLAVKNPPGSIASRTTTQSIPNGAFTDVTFPTEDFDTMAGFTAGGSVITVSAAGVWTIKGGIQWPANGTGTRALLIIVDGVELTAAGDERIPTAAATTRQVVSADVKLTAGQQIKMQAFQSSGGALNINVGRFSVIRCTGP